MHAVKSARLFLIMSLAALPRVHAESLAALTVALGGDNHAGDDPQLFTPGSTLNDRVYAVGQVITWDVTLAVSGIQASGPGSGYPVWGAANIVYDLELRRGAVRGNWYRRRSSSVPPTPAKPRRLPGATSSEARDRRG